MALMKGISDDKMGAFIWLYNRVFFSTFLAPNTNITYSSALQLRLAYKYQEGKRYIIETISTEFKEKNAMLACVSFNLSFFRRIEEKSGE
jgi:hypothetical protein